MIDLNETWQLVDFAPGEGIRAGAHTVTFETDRAIPVGVPGDVYRALIAAGRIPDPFYDRNELDCAWVAQREWWYRRTFDVPEAPKQADECWRLLFHGLDTAATVYLNGEALGSSRNMFRETTFDITDRLRVGASNTLAVCFDDPLRSLTPERIAAFSAWGRSPERVFLRKAQFGYGWDWAPRLPTIGIWRPVEIVTEQQAHIVSEHFYTLEIKDDTALVAVQVEIERIATDAPLRAHVELEHAGQVYQTDLILKGDRATAYIAIPQPQLWWTHDLGEPVLHTLRLSLYAGDRLLAQRSRLVGVRTIMLDQSPDTDEPGTRFFRFILNGVPIFARGADWIPADSFVGGLPAIRYEMLLTAAQRANMNMMRIWGGGIYEHDIFYDLCSRLGILVWQDFMFACAMYPEDDPEFNAEVAAEVTYQVRRLRSHPCMALWCGSNENQWLHDQIFWDVPNNRVPGALFYHDIIPSIVQQLDGHIPYWFGSPYGGSDYTSMEDGNRHNWQVWHGDVPRRFGEKPERVNTPEGVSYLHYAEDMGRFISEFGMHAAPVKATLEKVIPSDQLYHHSLSMDHHNKDDPKNKGDNLMAGVTGLPQTLDEYIDFSMIAQAEGLKFGIEHFRRRKPHCSGTLFWQFNDCWPALSWSIIDYYGVGKASYYYIKRVYAPVLASFKPLKDGSAELWLTNDTLRPVDDTVTARLRSFSGETLREETQQVKAQPNSSAVVLRLRDVPMAANTYLSVSAQGNSFPDNRLFFAPIKDLQRKPVEPQIATRQIDSSTFEIRFYAEQFAYFVHIMSADETAEFSDNYFDIEPGGAKTVIVRGITTPDSLTFGWR